MENFKLARNYFPSYFDIFRDVLSGNFYLVYKVLEWPLFAIEIRKQISSLFTKNLLENTQ